MSKVIQVLANCSILMYNHAVAVGNCLHSIGGVNMGYLNVLAEARSVMATGSYDAAEQAERLLTRYAMECGDPVEKGMALHAAADVMFRQGKVHAAVECFQEAEGYLLNDNNELLKLYSSWAILSDEHGIPDHVPYLVSRLSDLLAAEGCSGDTMVFGHLALARLYARLRDHERAVAAAEEAVRLADSLQVARAEAYSALSKALEASGRVAEAMETLEHAMLYMKEGHCLMNAMAEYGRLALLCGDRKTATQYLMRAVELPDHRDRQVLANVLRVVAQLVSEDPVNAASILERIAAHLGNCNLGR